MSKSQYVRDMEEQITKEIKEEFGSKFQNIWFTDDAFVVDVKVDNGVYMTPKITGYRVSSVQTWDTVHNIVYRTDEGDI